MTRKEVEELLSVSYATVRRMRLRGELIAYRMGRKIYFRRSEVLAAVMSNPIEVTPVEASAEEVSQAA